MSGRDLIGYGSTGSPLAWPNGARLAVSFVINYEEGAELSPLYHDSHAEVYGGEYPLPAKPKGRRNLSMESLFEYGARCGIWRLIRLFDQEKIPVTFFITAFALSQNQALCDYLNGSEHEVAAHGWRWLDYAKIPKNTERKHIKHCLNSIEELTGRRPRGWYTGRRSEHTVALLQEIGGFLYLSDSYADDCPYYQDGQLFIPYTLDCNDFRFSTSPGFSEPLDFYHQLKDTFDFLYQEQRNTMMSIGLHPRFSGHPGRAMALAEFIAYLKSYPDVWVARRVDIARHWRLGLPI